MSIRLRAQHQGDQDQATARRRRACQALFQQLDLMDVGALTGTQDGVHGRHQGVRITQVGVCPGSHLKW